MWEAIAADDVTALKTSAGVGKLSSSSSGTAVAAAKVADVASSVASSSAQSSTTAAAPTSTSTSKSPAATTAAVKAEPTVAEKADVASDSVATRWVRCGGNGWTGAIACEEGSKCTVINDCKQDPFQTV